MTNKITHLKLLFLTTAYTARLIPSLETKIASCGCLLQLGHQETLFAAIQEVQVPRHALRAKKRAINVHGSMPADERVDHRT
jgi:hypothetical protein